MKKRLIVIGNGMAGVKTVEEIIHITPDLFDIHIFGDEPHGNYNRVMLSHVLSGDQSVENIIINDLNWYKNNNLTLHSGEHKKIIRIDRKTKQVFTANGAALFYDQLIIATGSTPFIAPIDGIDLSGVLTFRTIEDVEKMLIYANQTQHAIVQGGGLLGLEAAFGLAKRGMQVTVLHNRDYLLNRQLDQQAADLLQHFLQNHGVKFVFSDTVDQLVGNDKNHVTSIRLHSGSVIPCDLLVVAIGIRPNIDLAKTSGFLCHRGIAVSDVLKTNDSSVYAVGECTEYNGETFGMVAPLFDQAKVLAAHICGYRQLTFKSSPPPTKLKVAGVDLFSMGDFTGNADTEILVLKDVDQAIYKKLVIKGTRLVGVILYGDVADSNWYEELINDEMNISSIRSSMMFGKMHCQALISALVSDNEHLSPNNKSNTKVA